MAVPSAGGVKVKTRSRHWSSRSTGGEVSFLCQGPTSCHRVISLSKSLSNRTVRFFIEQSAMICNRVLVHRFHRFLPFWQFQILKSYGVLFIALNMILYPKTFRSSAKVLVETSGSSGEHDQEKLHGFLEAPLLVPRTSIKSNVKQHRPCS